MRFHDYHLKGYSVLDSGARIVLNLAYDYPGTETRESVLVFEDVSCYHFKHTAGAIITDLEEVSLDALVTEEAVLLASFAQEHGLAHWKTDAGQYAETLRNVGMRAWRLESAIGFSGFVIAGNVVSTP